MKKGNPYGTHRVISPKGVLPQPADVIDNTMEIYDNEVLIDVKTLNIDSASFTEICKQVLGKKPAEIETQEEKDKIAECMYLTATQFEDKADEIRAMVTEICKQYPLYE